MAGSRVGSEPGLSPGKALSHSSGRGPARVTQLPSSAKGNCSLSQAGW